MGLLDRAGGFWGAPPGPQPERGVSRSGGEDPARPARAGGREIGVRRLQPRLHRIHKPAAVMGRFPQCHAQDVAPGFVQLSPAPTEGTHLVQTCWPHVDGRRRCHADLVADRIEASPAAVGRAVRDFATGQRQAGPLSTGRARPVSVVRYRSSTSRGDAASIVRQAVRRRGRFRFDQQARCIDSNRETLTDQNPPDRAAVADRND